MKSDLKKHIKDNRIDITDIDICLLSKTISKGRFEFWCLKSDYEVDLDQITQAQYDYVKSLYDEESCCYDTNKFINDVIANDEMAIDVVTNAHWWLYKVIDLTKYKQSELQEHLDYLINLPDTTENNRLKAKVIFMNKCSNNEID